MHPASLGADEPLSLGQALFTLRDLVAALGSQEGPAKLIPSVLRTLARTVNASGCAFFEHNETEVIRLRYLFQNDETRSSTDLDPSELLRYPLFRQLIDGFTAPEEYLGVSCRAVRGGVVLDHANGTAVEAFDTFAVARKWSLELNVPVVVGNAAVGGLVIYRDGSTPFTDHEVAMAEHLAEHLSLAVGAQSMAARVRRDAEQLAIQRARHDLARELHDTVAQALSGSVMQVRQAKYQMRTSEDTSFRSLVAAEEQLLAGLRDVRRLVAELRPRPIAGRSLITVLRRFIEDIQETAPDLTIRLTSSGRPVSLAHDVTYGCLRIMQSAIVNAVRHSGAREVKVEIHYDSAADERVRLIVRDDGIGFDLAAIPPGRFGLLGMAERAAEIDADFVVDSSKAEGTSVTLTLGRNRTISSVARFVATRGN